MRETKHTGPASATVTSEETPPLSPYRAFVVQFRIGAGAERKRFVGRVEHMVSGQAMPFESSKDLVTFITRVLAEVRD